MKLWFVIFFVPLAMKGQSVTKDNVIKEKYVGIQWTTGLTWNQIKRKAKTEGKYIFVDCYATWCLPCKIMDKEVYPNDSVGRFINSNFISVRVQMDSSKGDNEEIKNWYTIAKSLKTEFSINVLPTYLFFSPNGEVVHKGVGGKKNEQFISLASDALNSSKQYFRLIRMYRNDSMRLDQIPVLALTARRVGDSKLSLDIADNYFQRYLSKLPENMLCSKDVFNFIAEFKQLVHSGDRIAKLCYKRPQVIDSLTRPGFSKELLENIIIREYILPKIEDAKKSKVDPNWKKISKNIVAKYGKYYANSTTLTVKMNYLRNQMDWGNYTKSIVEKVEFCGLNSFTGFEGAFELNNYAWEVFLHSGKESELTKALRWSDYCLSIDTMSYRVAGNIDTKANILYKMGKKVDAIETEKKAASLAPKDPEIQASLKKMINGEPTWE